MLQLWFWMENVLQKKIWLKINELKLATENLVMYLKFHCVHNVHSYYAAFMH